MNKGYMYILALSAAALAASCSHGGFTDEEKKIIGKPGDGIMRLWLVDNAEDSLLLRQPAAELTVEHLRSPEFAVLKDRMIATVKDPENPGVGIAAPQVGLPYRLVVVQRFDKEGQPMEFYVNPRITEYSADKAAGREGCLSVPGKWGTVERACSIEISYLHENTFEPVAERVEGFTAVIFQHEIDHLDGTLYTDRASEVNEE